MKGSPLRTKVERVGQPYYDAEIAETILPKPEFRSQLTVHVGLLFGSQPLPPLRVVTGHERINLRWMRPDGKGGLVPRKAIKTDKSTTSRGSLNGGVP